LVLESGGRGINCPYHVKKEVLQRIQEERKVLHTTKRRKANWIGHVLRQNWLLKHIIEGMIERAGRLGRRRKQLLNDLKEWEDTGN
jgi:ribosomal 50S subunit-associated protein YjgA (DUF615 family)